MYCPNCKQEYDGKFCPECGTKLIEKPATSGISLNLGGDANAISGGLHVSDSHAVHNEDKSVHNITNTTSTVNNITQVSAQKTEMELLQEKKALYLTECKRAYEDNVLEQSEVIVLEECRIKLGLDKSTADAILESVRVMSDRNARKSELNPIAKTKLKILTSNLQKNEVKALMDQIDSLEPLVRRFDHDELSRKYYLVLAALKPEKCIEQKERTKTDTYWEAFWSYLAYIKDGRLADAEDVLVSLDRFTNYPEDNMSVLAVAGALIMGDKAEAKEYLDAVTGEYTPALQRFVDSIYLLLNPDMAKEMGADGNTCAFYLVNFFGQKDPKAKAEDERLKRGVGAAEQQYNFTPTTKEELKVLVGKLIEERGNNANLNDINTSKITDMEDLFGTDDDNKVNPDVSGWDVSNVKNMASMFRGCASFEGKGLEHWSVSNVEDMGGMFDRCYCFNGDISSWDVSKVRFMQYMFSGCVIFNGDLSHWDVSNVENMEGMFNGCENFNSDLSQWDVSNVEDMSQMFEYCKNFEGKLLERWKEFDLNYVDGNPFNNCKSRPSWAAEGYEAEADKQQYNFFPTTKEELKELVGKLIKERGNDADLNDIDTSQITDMSFLFENSKFNGDISKWDVSNVKNMDQMFISCQHFNSDLSCWNVSSVKSMTGMFMGCILFNIDLSKWDVSNVEWMNCMFDACKQFTGRGLDNWNVSNVLSMAQMFRVCKRLTCNLSDWDVSNVKNMGEMFCLSQFSGDISKWNVSNVEDMEDMFSGSPLEGNPPKWYKE